MIGRIFRVVRTPVTLLILLACSATPRGGATPTSSRPCRRRRRRRASQQSLAKGQLSPARSTSSVFNGGDSRGLAGDVGRALRARASRSRHDEHHREDRARRSSSARARSDPEVLLVKSFFKDAEVRADGRADHSVDVLVGNKYGGFNKKAKTTYRGEASDALCLPPQETTSPSADRPPDRARSGRRPAVAPAAPAGRPAAEGAQPVLGHLPRAASA